MIQCRRTTEVNAKNAIWQTFHTWLHTHINIVIIFVEAETETEDSAKITTLLFFASPKIDKIWRKKSTIKNIYCFVLKYFQTSSKEMNGF